MEEKRLNMENKGKHTNAKTKMHVRNKHRGRYDFDLLTAAHEELNKFLKPNIHGDLSVDFFDPLAVMALNTALVKTFYGIKEWNLPSGYLCPAVPGRADYIHHISDILGGYNYGKVPAGKVVRCLDIGVGASCIYPVIGVAEYGWSFVGSDIDEQAIESARKICTENKELSGNVEIRFQKNPKDIFYGLIKEGERFDLSLCNPPFHASAQDARRAATRKISNLKNEQIKDPVLNFGGQSKELYCEGGEERFVREIIRESRRFSHNVVWFTTLISKQNHLKAAYKSLKKAEATENRTISMGQGNKSSRILAWTYHNKEEIADWQIALQQ